MTMLYINYISRKLEINKIFKTRLVLMTQYLWILKKKCSLIDRLKFFEPSAPITIQNDYVHFQHFQKKIIDF